ncbi:hypothetical protein T439DRAFT_323608 [Meredithblackwellia eburnea MCA 4105]
MVPRPRLRPTIPAPTSAFLARSFSLRVSTPTRKSLITITWIAAGVTAIATVVLDTLPCPARPPPNPDGSKNNLLGLQGEQHNIHGTPQTKWSWEEKGKARMPSGGGRRWLDDPVVSTATGTQRVYVVRSGRAELQGAETSKKVDSTTSSDNKRGDDVSPSRIKGGEDDGSAMSGSHEGWRGWARRKIVG